MTKKDFIRRQSQKLSAAEVVAAGEKEGLKFSEAYVHVTRSQDRKAAPKKVPGKRVQNTVKRILAQAEKQILSALKGA